MVRPPPPSRRRTWLRPEARPSSPNHSSRGGRPPRAIVIHATGGGGLDGALETLTSHSSGVSAHFLLDRDGSCLQLVALDRAAWHCGVAEVVLEGEAYSEANALTVGIELCNWLDAAAHYGHLEVETMFASLRYDDGRVVSGRWEPYSEAQLEALAEIVADLRHDWGPLPLVGHEEIAMPLGRKRDPGPLFPWSRLERLGPPRRTQSLRGRAPAFRLTGSPVP